MAPHFRFHRIAASCAALFAAAAQAADAPPGEPESIVVEGRFIASGAQSAMKLDVPVRDTPFSVSSYSDSFMKAIETTNVADMYNYMTGIRRAGNTGYDLSIRGFRSGSADRNSILVNGLPGLAGRLGSPPTAAIDHVEVVKGPASVLYGVAQPGGFVNIIGKRPLDERATVLDLKGVAYAGGGIGLSDSTGYNASIDTTGPADADKRLLYRLVFDRVDRDLFRTNTYERTTYVAPSLTWRPMGGTSLSFGAEVRQADNAYDLYLVAPNKDINAVAPYRTRYQSPSDYRNEKARAITLGLTQSLPGDAVWSTSVRLARQQDDTSGFDNVAVATAGFSTDGAPCTAAAPCLRMRARGQHNESRWDFIDSNVGLTVATGAISHKLLAGVNGGREISDFDRLQFFNGLTSCPTAASANCLTVHVANPVYNFLPLSSYATTPAGTPLTRLATTSLSEGLYVSDVATLSEHWKATLGARYAVERQRIRDIKNPGTAVQFKETRKATPMAGLLYQPTPEWTIYGSYSTSYVPASASAQDTTGRNPFRPESAKQFEAGAKVELPRGLGSATFAAYRIRKNDALSTFACPIGTCTQQLGQEESKGMELEANLQLTERWQFAAGIAHTDAKVTRSTDPALVDARLLNSPRDDAHVWTRFDFDGAWKGFALGGGANFTGDRAGTLPSTADTRVLRLPSYALVDLAAYYTRGAMSFTFKVGNVFDRRYYESAGFQGGDIQILPGAPRNVQLSARMAF